MRCCDHGDCPGCFASSLSKRTFRLSSALELIGLAIGGEAGARLARELDMVAAGGGGALPRLTTSEPEITDLEQSNYARPSLRAVGVDDWALSIINSCGKDGATALASAVRALRTSTDAATLDYMRYQTGSFRDAEVFAALLDVAGDPAASVPARVYATLALDDITDPDLRYSFKDATTELDDLGRPRCYGRLQMVSDKR